MAIPIEEWSLDLVTPNSECVRKNGQCIAAVFPDAPDESAVVPFNRKQTRNIPIGGSVELLIMTHRPPFLAEAAGEAERPKGILDEDANLLYVDEADPIMDIHGRVPKPGLYVLVAQYYSPDEPSKQIVNKLALI